MLLSFSTSFFCFLSVRFVTAGLQYAIVCRRREIPFHKRVQISLSRRLTLPWEYIYYVQYTVPADSERDCVKWPMEIFTQIPADEVLIKIHVPLNAHYEQGGMRRVRNENSREREKEGWSEKERGKSLWVYEASPGALRPFRHSLTTLIGEVGYQRIINFTTTRKVRSQAQG